MLQQAFETSSLWKQTQVVIGNRKHAALPRSARSELKPLMAKDRAFREKRCLSCHAPNTECWPNLLAAQSAQCGARGAATRRCGSAKEASKESPAA